MGEISADSFRTSTRVMTEILIISDDPSSRKKKEDIFSNGIIYLLGWHVSHALLLLGSKYIETFR